MWTNSAHARMLFIIIMMFPATHRVIDWRPHSAAAALRAFLHPDERVGPSHNLSVAASVAREGDGRRDITWHHPLRERAWGQTYMLVGCCVAKTQL